MTARATLLHLLGDLVHPSRAAIPTSAFLAAMGDAGHEAPSARQALARTAGSGWIGPERRGRETWWSLTDRGARLIADGLARIADLGREDEPWDGRWVVVVTTISHERRAVRERVYRYLSWSGFGMPVPGVWVSPHAADEHGARFAIDHFGLAAESISFVGRCGSVGLLDDEIVARAWPLEDLDQHYATLLQRHHPPSPEPTPRAALTALLALDADLRLLPLRDPHLPPELAPGRASRPAARELLLRRADLLRRAAPHWRELARR